MWREHMDIDTKERVAEIRRLNIEFRTMFRGGQILLTASVAPIPKLHLGKTSGVWSATVTAERLTTSDTLPPNAVNL